MLERIFLDVRGTDDLGLPFWEELFADCPLVEIVTELRRDADATLQSPMMTERFGARGGAKDALGIMELFDSWRFSGYETFRPRFLVADAVWQREPPIEEWVDIKTRLLSEILREHNETTPDKVKSTDLI